MDTTAQSKAVPFPSNARLYRKIHGAMLRIAEKEGLTLRQSYRKLVAIAPSASTAAMPRPRSSRVPSPCCEARRTLEGLLAQFGFPTE